MGDQAFLAEHALEGKPDKDRVKLNGTFVTAITDKTAFLPAGTFNLEKLQSIYYAIILLLRKIIVFFKDNCYHGIGSSTKGAWLLVLPVERQASFVGLGLSFSLKRPSSIISFFYTTRQ